MATPDRPPVKDRPDRLPLPRAGEAPGESGAPVPEAPRGLRGLLAWGAGAAWSCRRLLVFILAVNLVMAAAVLFPLLGPMDDTLALHPEAPAAGRQMDARWWHDLELHHATIFRGAIGSLGWAALATVILGTFFAGGLLSALKHGRHHPLGFEPMPDPAYGEAIPQWRAAAPGPASVRVFLRESAGHFPRLLVLLLVSLVLYALVELIFNRLAGTAAGALLDVLEDERAALLVGVLKSALFVGAFHAVTVVFEYARAHEILRPGTTLLPMLALPFRLLRRRPAAFLGIEAAAVLLQAAAVLAFMPLDGLLAARPAIAVTAGLAATQVFMFARIFIRAAAQAAQLRLAEDHLQGLDRA